MKQEENWAWKQNIYGQEKLMLVVMARQSNGWIFRGSAAELSTQFGIGPGAIRKAQRLVASLLKQGYVKRDTSNMSHNNTGFILNHTSDMSLVNVNNVVADKVSNPLNEYNNNNNNIIISNSPINPSLVSLKDDWATHMSLKFKGVAEKKLTEEFIAEINKDYKDLPLLDEAKKFALYWTEGRRKVKNIRLAWRNWLDRNKRNINEGKKVKSIVVQPGGQEKDPFAEF
tara:strand:- start:1431 stop:2114 length:684 start_codon:yes stop_codon:yes gene_type:complete